MCGLGQTCKKAADRDLVDEPSRDELGAFKRMERRPVGLEGVREECRQRFSQGGRQGPYQVWLPGWAACLGLIAWEASLAFKQESGGVRLMHEITLIPQRMDDQMAGWRLESREVLHRTPGER